MWGILNTKRRKLALPRVVLLDLLRSLFWFKMRNMKASRKPLLIQELTHPRSVQSTSSHAYTLLGDLSV